MSAVKLTIKDLIEICEFMGIPKSSIKFWKECMSDWEEETEFTIHESFKGIAVYDEDAEKEDRYRVVVTCDGCDTREVQPIGDPL